LFMVILGGTGTLPGPVIGAFIVVFVPEVLRMAAEWRSFFFALFMLIMIIFMPLGLWGFVKVQQWRYLEWQGMRWAEGKPLGLQRYLGFLAKDYLRTLLDFLGGIKTRFSKETDQES
jgi:hypothetical protein